MVGHRRAVPPNEDLDRLRPSSIRSLAMLAAMRRTLKLARLARRLAVWSRRQVQDGARRWIYQMGAFARSADDGFIHVGIHGHIVGGKALNAKAGVRAVVKEKRHGGRPSQRLRWLALIWLKGCPV